MLSKAPTHGRLEIKNNQFLVYKPISAGKFIPELVGGVFIAHYCNDLILWKHCVLILGTHQSYGTLEIYLCLYYCILINNYFSQMYSYNFHLQSNKNKFIKKQDFKISNYMYFSFDMDIKSYGSFQNFQTSSNELNLHT